ncbi:MAG: hypothetical protein ACJ71P_13950 [Nitrososphaeraceae archaeon]
MASSNEGSKNIDWDDVIKKEARGINDADFGEVQLIMGDTVITEKGITDKKRFYLPKSLVDKFDGHNLWFRIANIEILNRSYKLKYKEIGHELEDLSRN